MKMAVTENDNLPSLQSTIQISLQARDLNIGGSDMNFPKPIILWEDKPYFSPTLATKNSKLSREQDER